MEFMRRDRISAPKSHERLTAHWRPSARRQLAWSGALPITLNVLALNIGARILAAERIADE
jgi:hypothetical protein